MKKLSLADKFKLKTLLTTKLSFREISAEMGVSPSTVSNYSKKLNLRNDHTPSGPKKLFSPRSERQILKRFRDGTLTTATEAVDYAKNSLNIVSSAETIRRLIKSNGMKVYSRRKKPLLRRTHIQKRLAFARRHKNWTISQWNRVIFSDESKFNLFGSDGRSFCWRFPNEPPKDHHIRKTVKYGGGVIMLWGCINGEKVGKIHRINGKMDYKMFIDVLKAAYLENLPIFNLEKNDSIL
jgi:transposase